jgi:hypothetical protein
LIRGWFAAGKPAFGGMALGTYTIWKEMVGGILKNSGFEKFLRNQRQLYSEMDRESEDWEGFLLQIRANLSEFTVKDIVPLIGKLETLPLEVAKIYGQTMSHDKSVPNPFFGVQLGHILRRHCNTRYGPNEVYLERVGENTHTKVTRYAIRRGK